MDKHIFQWAVIGAGPAGIAAIGQLIDQGIKPTEIIWLDPDFNVGDLGRLWSNVSSNTKAELFVRFLQAAKSFEYKKADFELNHLPQSETCTLSYVKEPLQWVTKQLLEKVSSATAHVKQVQLTKRRWIVTTDAETYQAKNVILATGAVPLQLNYPEIETVPFEIAIDKNRLQNAVNLRHTYAVFGSSHSAIMIVRYLVELGVEKIINFYRTPCRYALSMGDWILFDNTGLKGLTAEWAREHIDGEWPKNLIRHTSNEQNILRYLPECQKAIYAVGFKPRHTIILGDYEHLQYDPYTGIIGPGLFGLGIGYPERYTDPLGHVESHVGLWKFMVYLKRIMPIWLQYCT
jgi:cation diffusion facilitator CzcD-associated flavoprotein CzcO